MASIQQVVFHLGDEEYGLDIMKVNGIEKYQKITKVPNAPSYIEGIINLRGEVLPIYNLRKRFNMDKIAYDDETKIIVVFTNDMRVGIIVDSVAEIIQIDVNNIEKTPKVVVGVNRKYIKSVAKVNDRMIIILDLELMMSEEEKSALGEILETNA